tara:strand:+ start:443 stop:808 length:366 start_codon:yes stop_codon:yes gene_type:complete
VSQLKVNKPAKWCEVMENVPVVRMWVTNKNGKKITSAMSESMICFLSVAVENGCIGSTFAEDEQRVIVYTQWSDEITLEQFRSSKDYQIQESQIIQSFTEAGFNLASDVLFNSTALVIFSN